jgi:hypothetical protein
MKTTLNILLLSATLISTAIKAEEMTLPKIVSPLALQEGIQRELSASQIAEILPWAKDSKIFLVDLLDAISSLPMDQKIESLQVGIAQVVTESASKQSEMIMRYSLNRALVLNEILNKETTEGAVGTSDAKARLLIASIKLALKYYDSDIANISSKKSLPYAAFGVEYFQFLTELNKSIFDASAQYNIQRTALEFLQWDLYRDVNNASFAPQIVKINNSLKMYPTKRISDAYSINYIRQMKKTIENLQLGATAKAEERVTSNKTLNTNGKYVSLFSSYNSTNYCYPADRNGNRLGDEMVSIALCQSGYASIYSSYNSTNYCYPVDAQGKKLGDSNVDIKFCRAGYAPFYSSYYSTNYCYPVDAQGKKLGDNTVNISLCQ